MKRWHSVVLTFTILTLAENAELSKYVVFICLPFLILTIRSGVSRRLVRVLLPLIGVLLISLFQGSSSLYENIKDIILLARPIIYYLVFYGLMKLRWLDYRSVDFYIFIKVLIAIAIWIVDGMSLDLQYVRYSSGAAYWPAVYLLVNFKNSFMKKLAGFWIVLISSSRVVIGSFISLIVLRNSLLKMLLILIPSVVLLAPLVSGNSRLLNTFDELSFNSHMSQSDMSKQWRGYEHYLMFSEFTEWDMATKVFGRGLGSNVRTGLNSVELPLGILSRFHNSLLTVLLKSGLVGILFILSHFIILFKLLDKSENVLLFSYILLVFSSLFTMGYYTVNISVFPILFIVNIFLENHEGRSEHS